MITLSWKEFSVDVKRIRTDLVALLSANYDGIVCDSDSIKVMFIEEPSVEDSDAVTAYWDGITPETFASPAPPTIEEIVRMCTAFGQNMILELSAEPEIISLTTEQMVQLITTLGPVQLMLMTGALGTALYTVQNTDTTGLLSPELVAKYTTKLTTFLGV